MDAISRGDYTAAKEYLNQTGSYGLEQRLADTIRDKKNYTPLFLIPYAGKLPSTAASIRSIWTNFSSRFAIQLETLHNVSKLDAMQGEMVYKYSLWFRIRLYQIPTLR